MGATDDAAQAANLRPKATPASSVRTARLVALASLAVFIAALIPLALRVRDFNANAGFMRLHAQEIITRGFQFGSSPQATLTDAADAAGNPALRLNYGSIELLIPVKAPPVKNLPTLGSYDEWVAVLAINEVELERKADGSARSAPKPGTDRVFIVVRRTPEGFDPETWGSVRRDDWVFDFYELMPDGDVETWMNRWPRGRRAEARLQTEPDNPLRAIPPLKERTPEYFAAMHVIPKLNVPRYKFGDTALSPRVLGWTLPVSMLSFLVFTGGLIFALAPPVRRSTPQ